MAEIAVVDYGMGNLRSVSKALEHVAPGMTVAVTDDPAVIARAKRVVFPGVGAMRDCMRELDARSLRPALLQAAQEKPFLGICLGMQMLFEFSEEGNVEGLGILPGRVMRFASNLTDAAGNKLKVPHMGWNEVTPVAPHPLWQGIPAAERFYFVHSYYVSEGQPALRAAVTAYPTPFTSVVARGNLFAVQFHPEKSQSAGLQLLRNFAAWDGAAERS
jgi:glutamine amidotransferase